MKIEKPKTRQAEVLNYFLVNPKKWYSHYDFASALKNINSHKVIGVAEDNGMTFEKKEVSFTNRFGRSSSIKTFRLKTQLNNAIKIYNKMN